MKKSLFYFFIILILFISACTDEDAGEAPENTNGEPEYEAESINDDIIVSTSSGDITEEEFYQTLKDTYGEYVLRDLVEQKIVEGEAESLNINEDEIEEEINLLKEEVGAQSDEQFFQMMQQQGVMNEEDLRARILKHLVLQHHIGHVGDITDEEIEAEYEKGEEVNARHILVTEEEEAIELYERIQDGESFEELAVEYSTDPGSSEDGGELGFFRRGTMTAPFEETAFNQEVSEVSEPVQSQFGYHIIETLERNPFEDELEEVSDSLRTALNNRKLAKMSVKQEELFDNIDIEVHDSQFEHLFQ
ncbi:peptidylprolyl isomerase [Evansella halocellulosilytica]|uniref:peptidylprolyl isomerase n=1 Tax=Evansella halocellulosilytica TaxID=2011013 RepID=UPI000BB84FDF|nr:peptidylprolyl isomerase [Evansella halocellulosilytica]